MVKIAINCPDREYKKVLDIKSINETQYRIWFFSPSGKILNESVLKSDVIILDPKK